VLWLSVCITVVTFNLLLQYVCHSVECKLYCQFGSADNTVLYTDFVVAFSLHYSV
jgi:hypothetical protein